MINWFSRQSDYQRKQRQTKVNQTGKNFPKKKKKKSGKVSKRENKRPFTKHTVKTEILENNLRLIISQAFH